MRCRRAFTLVEILVVIGIIAVLIAMLLPSLSRARRAGKRIECASNLRQLGQAAIMYTEANRGFFPPMFIGPWIASNTPPAARGMQAWAGRSAVFWPAASYGAHARPLNPHLRANLAPQDDVPVARCPEDTLKVYAAPSYWEEEGTSYNWNCNFTVRSLVRGSDSPTWDFAGTDMAAQLGVNRTTIRNASRFVMAGDAGAAFVAGYIYGSVVGLLTSGTFGYSATAYWHDSTVTTASTSCPFNVLYVDGHVALERVRDYEMFSSIRDRDWLRP